MQRFIPFEDDWEAFERIGAGGLVPYCVDLALANDAFEPVDGGVLAVVGRVACLSPIQPHALAAEVSPSDA